MAKKKNDLSPLEVEMLETEEFIKRPLSFYLIRVELLSMYERAFSRDHQLCEMVRQLCEAKSLDNPSKFVDYLNKTALKDSPDAFKPVLVALKARLERLRLQMVQESSDPKID